MDRFKNGDRVQVRGDLRVGKYYGGYEFTKEMDSRRYAEGTIVKKYHTPVKKMLAALKD